jgi:chromate reductase
MKIVAFGASFSQNSINKQLAAYTASLFEDASVKILDLNDYQLPIYTIELEQQMGYPDAVHQFLKDIEGADLMIVSFAEYNGSYTAGFKNIFDWASRVNLQLFEGKMFLLATATGGGGGRYVLQSAVQRFPKHGAEIVATFYLPFFHQNFSPTDGITHPEYLEEFTTAVQQVKNSFY